MSVIFLFFITTIEIEHPVLPLGFLRAKDICYLPKCNNLIVKTKNEINFYNATNGKKLFRYTPPKGYVVSEMSPLPEKDLLLITCYNLRDERAVSYFLDPKVSSPSEVIHSTLKVYDPIIPKNIYVKRLSYLKNGRYVLSSIRASPNPNRPSIINEMRVVSLEWKKNKAIVSLSDLPVVDRIYFTKSDDLKNDRIQFIDHWNTMASNDSQIYYASQFNNKFITFKSIHDRLEQMAEVKLDLSPRHTNDKNRNTTKTLPEGLASDDHEVFYRSHVKLTAFQFHADSDGFLVAWEYPVGEPSNKKFQLVIRFVDLWGQPISKDLILPMSLFAGVNVSNELITLKKVNDKYTIETVDLRPMQKNEAGSSSR